MQKKNNLSSPEVNGNSKIKDFDNFQEISSNRAPLDPNKDKTIDPLSDGKNVDIKWVKDQVNSLRMQTGASNASTSCQNQELIRKVQLNYLFEDIKKAMKQSEEPDLR